jgi:antitoxin (DNA-binding transcriptional repressor) of toxin-antitoxin stability system
VRELRQRASELLRLVERGETIEITDRGRPVARLGPVPLGTPLEQMHGAGEIEAASAGLDDLPEPLVLPDNVETPSAALRRLRRDERWAMAATYVDSSAIVKLAVREPQSDALRNYLRRRRTVISSAFARTEVMRALLPGGEPALAAGRRVLDRVDLVRVNDRVLNWAGTLLPL